MKKSHPISVNRAFAEGAPIDRALKKGARDALLKHKQAGIPACEWRDGQLVWIAPQALKVPHSQDKRPRAV